MSKCNFQASSSVSALKIGKMEIQNHVLPIAMITTRGYCQICKQKSNHHQTSLDLHKENVKDLPSEPLKVTQCGCNHPNLEPPDQTYLAKLDWPVEQHHKQFTQYATIFYSATLLSFKTGLNNIKHLFITETPVYGHRYARAHKHDKVNKTKMSPNS